MCLIIYCEKGSDKTNDFLEEAILKASEFNTDGMGYAIKRPDGSLFINKGFFNVNNFIEHIKDENVGLDDELLIHLRIGNEGKVNTDMCHPFVVSNKEDEILEILEGYVDKPLVAHNGTMKRHAVTNSDKSDTFFFIKNLLSRPSILELLKTDVNTFEYALSPHLNLSRLCVMFPGEDKTKLVGKWHDVKGYKFSKDYYVEYFPKPKSNSIYHLPRNVYGSEWEDEYFEQNKQHLQNSYVNNRDDSFEFKGKVKIPVLKYPRESFRDWIGNKHMLYMGAYFPVSQTIRDYTIDVTTRNYRKCSIECVESDYEIGIFKYSPYRIIEVTPTNIKLIDMDNMYEVVIKKSNFYEIFSVTWEKDYLAHYSKYLDLVKQITVTKSMTKKLESIITRASASKNAKNYISFRYIKFIPIDIAIEFLNNAEHELEIQKTPELLLF